MNGKRPLLIVEDDPGLQSQLRWCFDDYEVIISGDRSDAINQLRRHEPGVILLDLGLPPDPGGVTEGLATLKEVISLAPEVKVIVVTGDNDRKNAVEAISLGAYDFYQKPIDSTILTSIVARAYHVHDLELENSRLRESGISSPVENIIASSPEMLKVCRTIEKVAPSDITTLVIGASGTGKELVAQALHNLSPRRKQKMVAINCAAIPDNLLESELFGYEKGAFTGANKQTLGKIEYANNGTLFLDEIGDLPHDLQAKLLRFLQERVIERVGGRAEIPIDVRIICATHQNIPDLIEKGVFREDLYYRISEITINIPALCDRQGDTLVLAKAILHRFNRELNKSIKGFSAESLKAIESYPWPGNVRELESRIKRAIIMSDTAYISVDDLELPEVGTDNEDAGEMPLNLRQVREEAEKKVIIQALNKMDFNISDTSKLLGITRPTLYTLLEKYALSTSKSG